MDRYVPEIVIGFVAPAGADFTAIKGRVTRCLDEYGYGAVEVRLSDFLAQRSNLAGRLTPADEKRVELRVPALQAEGNLFRFEKNLRDALAFVALNEIVGIRAERNGSATNPQMTPVKALAFLIWSFKLPEEIATMRSIYREHFFVVSVHTPREKRANRLATQIAAGNNRIGGPNASDRADAEKIIEADEHEDLLGLTSRARVDSNAIKAGFGQNVRDAYPMGDFFVDPDLDESRPESLDRAIDIIFGHPYETPTSDEFGMFVATAAALRSAELGRQVGAAIIGSLGEVVAVGTNEVPAFGGGHYAKGMSSDDREFRRGTDTSDILRGRLVDQIQEQLTNANIIGEATEETASAIRIALGSTRIRDLTEFGRALHAESCALMDAARRGVAVKGLTICVTTFPCHQCTRQVIAAGLVRLVYVYPYPKSLAGDLHGDAIEIDRPGVPDKLHFEPFLGVAPRRYLQAFTAGRRKDADGKAVPAEDRDRSPRLLEGDESGEWDAATYIVREQHALRQTQTVFSSETGKG